MNEIAPKFIFIYENKGALSKSWKIGIKLKLQSRVVSQETRALGRKPKAAR